MNFRSRSSFGSSAEPEINLIPFIDVLLVVLIFLMLSTTYSKFSELQLKLPVADTQAQRDRPKELIVAVTANGQVSLGAQPVADRSVPGLAAALSVAAAAGAGPQTVLVISADGNAPHQSVISVMEAAQRAGLSQITFAAQTSASAGAR